MSYKFDGAIIENKIGGQAVSIKQRVRAATILNGTLGSSFTSGSVIDGVTLSLDDRILLKDQTDAKENGLYIVTAGAPARAEDFLVGDNVSSMLIIIDEGTVNSQSLWIIVNATPNDVVGTDNIVLTLMANGTHINDVTNPHSVTLEQARTENKLLAGSIDMGNNIIENVAVPVSSTDGVPRSYVDDHSLGVEDPRETAVITYDGSDRITNITYSPSTDTKVITYNIDDTVNTVTLTINSVVTVRTYNYTLGLLTSIT